MTKWMIDFFGCSWCCCSAVELATEKMTFSSLFTGHPSHSLSPETKELSHHIPLSDYMPHTTGVRRAEVDTKEVSETSSDNSGKRKQNTEQLSLWKGGGDWSKLRNDQLSLNNRKPRLLYTPTYGDGGVRAPMHMQLKFKRTQTA